MMKRLRNILSFALLGVVGIGMPFRGQAGFRASDLRNGPLSLTARNTTKPEPSPCSGRAQGYNALGFRLGDFGVEGLWDL